MTFAWRIFKAFSCLLLLVLMVGEVSYGQSYGLAFSSHEVFQDKRTGVDLSPDKTLCFKNNFELSFDLSFIPNRETYFGYIVRIIEDDQRNIDFVYEQETNNKHFNVIVGEKMTKIGFDIPPNRLYQQWTKIRIKFDGDHNRLLLYYGNQLLTQNDFQVKQGSCYKILFGVNNYKKFQTTDIPPMKIRDIRINDNGTLKYNWPLNEEGGNIAHDVASQNDASVTNPVWVTAMHRDWQTVPGKLVNGVASVAFNPKEEELYIIAADTLYTYNTASAKWSSNAYNSGKLPLNQGNQAIYNAAEQTLYNFFPDQKFVSRYNFQTNSWDKKFLPGPVTDFWHLNKFFSSADSSLYFIGGYGHLLYKNTIQQYNLKTGNWKTDAAHGDFFMPRYLAGLGTTPRGDTAYILGGYGSSTGQQILNPRNIYDLMRFTVKDKAFKKMYELKISGEDFALANSLVIDDKTKTYYGLAFPQRKYDSNLQLISGSLTKPGYTLVGSNIPYHFHDVHSFADLYYCPSSKRFVAVTLLRTDEGQTKVNIYTLLGPPYGGGNTPAVAEAGGHSRWWLFAGLAVVIGGVAVYMFRKRSTGPIAVPAVVPEIQPVPALPVINADATTVAAPVSEVRNFNQQPHQKNAIILFGDLQVFDATGTDITKQFTPLIKELFLVILLYSVRWGRGLSSEKLNEILWSDKSAKSARNNRSVNIAKLKALLDKLGHCHLSKDTGYWKIDIDFNQIYVDYHNYLNIVKDKKELDINKIKCLSAITQRGNFLSNIEYEWLDVFKSEISNDVIDTYLHFAHSGQVQDQEFLIELANFIFSFDPVNEEAMVIKCKALSALGKHSLAKNTFENFTKEYRVIYDEEFKKDFHAVLE